MRIFPENLASFEHFFTVKKNLEDIFVNLIQTLTSEARILNPKLKHARFRGATPVGGQALHQFFLDEWIKCFNFFFQK